MWSPRGLMGVVEGLCRGRLDLKMQGTMLSEEPSHRANSEQTAKRRPTQDGGGESIQFGLLSHSFPM